MKTSSTAAFKPITLTVVIETEEELNALQDLVRMNVSVSIEVYGTGAQEAPERGTLQNVMQHIHDNLKNY